MRLEQMRRRDEMRAAHHERRAEGRRRARDRFAAVGRGVRLFGRSLPTVPAVLFLPVAGVLGFVLRLSGVRRLAVRNARRLAAGQRELLEREFGAEFPGTHGKPPPVRHDLRWLVCAPLLGVMALLPAAVLGCAVLFLTVFGSLLPLVLALVVVGLGSAPKVLAEYGNWSTALLSPARNARLEQRVRRLTETRADAVDAQAAELRRIERDLHDGVQARLVAMGLNLGAVEQLMADDPEAARALLAQSREASATALQELRGLVRGIHPPVLAERGLADAVRALALDSPLQTEVTEDLPGRAEAPVESAVYFAVSELLANAARHADAARVWIDLHHTGDALRVQVTDDGCGGADAGSPTGSGLRGIERRLGTFDGVLALSSPQGGPTIVTLELPCVLSSPRTSTSCGKG